MLLTYQIASFYSYSHFARKKKKKQKENENKRKKRKEKSTIMRHSSLMWGFKQAFWGILVLLNKFYFCYLKKNDMSSFQLKQQEFIYLFIFFTIFTIQI